jgi:uncharacterized membrane protein YecN with MAPEG domain
MPPISLPITTLLVLCLAAIYLLQTWSVIRMRRSMKIVLGDDGNRSVQKRIRGHANMAEQAPIFVIMVLLAEIQCCVSTTWLWALGATFLTGRVFHAYYFLDIGAHHRLRFWGMLMTLICQFAAILTLVVTLARG